MVVRKFIPREWVELRRLRMECKRPVGLVFVGDQRSEAEFCRSKGMFSLLIPFYGDMPDLSILRGLDLFVFLRGRRFTDGQAGVQLLQDIMAAEPRSMLTKLGWDAESKWIILPPGIAA